MIWVLLRVVLYYTMCSGKILFMTETLKECYISNHLSKQIIRSSTSAALNYGEAQSAESPSDFIHKISIVLKELREIDINLQLISGAKVCSKLEALEVLSKEINELISIFFKTRKTAKSNLR